MVEEKGIQEDQLENSQFTCHEHGKDLVPLLCEECDSLVCFDCIVKNHHGHKMCNISDTIEEKVNQLNDAVRKKESACFDLKRIQDNLQHRQREVKNKTEEMVQLVTEREKEIVREVQNVCQETIVKIRNMATELERPMLKDEESLNSLLIRDLFRNDTAKECIRSIFFYKKL